MGRGVTSTIRFVGIIKNKVYKINVTMVTYVHLYI